MERNWTVVFELAEAHKLRKPKRKQYRKSLTNMANCRKLIRVD